MLITGALSRLIRCGISLHLPRGEGWGPLREASWARITILVATVAGRSALPGSPAPTQPLGSSQGRRGRPDGWAALTDSPSHPSVCEHPKPLTPTSLRGRVRPESPFRGHLMLSLTIKVQCGYLPWDVLVGAQPSRIWVKLHPPPPPELLSSQ